jgi:UDP-glucose:(heptosyl)LPS alpha-1,3-glucosyltransferase
MNKRHRIAVVIPKYGLIGGAEGFAASLTNQLACDSVTEIHVFTNRHIKGEETERIFFHHVPIISFPRFFKTPSFAVFAQRAINRAGIDIIHAHDRMFGPDLYTMHGLPHRLWVREVRKKKRPSLFDRGTIWVEERMVAGGACRYFLAVSRLTRDLFLREYPVDPAFVPVVHPGIDPEDAIEIERGTKDEARQTINRRFGLPPEASLIIFASMNFDIKGLSALLAGLGRLKSRRPTQLFHLIIVGGDNRHRYEKEATALGIANHITFTGAVSRKELGSIYAAGDLYAMLSKFDTFGMVVLEAMAKGLPVVISGNVGARDLVREGVNGFVVSVPQDADLVAEAIFQALRPDMHPALSRAALATAREYTWERSARQVADIYQKILDARGIGK